MAGSNVSAVTTNFFPKANEGFITTVGGSGVTSGGNTVPLNSVAGLTNGTVFVGIIEPGTAAEQTFTGVVDVPGLQITSVKWTRGVNVGHAAGKTVVDLVSGTYINLMQKGITTSINQDGTLKTSAVQAALNIPSTPTADWTTLAVAPTTVVNNGNRSYTLTYPSVNYSDRLQPGTRLQFTRTVASPNQSSLLPGSGGNYFRKTTPTGISFTDDFAGGAWIKLDVYPTIPGVIISRYDGTNGWYISVNEYGQVKIAGFNGAFANSRVVQSIQSVPLGKWVHVAAQLDMSTWTATSTTCYIMIDGVDVPVSLISSGTNPTSLVQAGNLEVGAWNSGSNQFKGALAQVWVSSAKITQANMRTLMSQGLTSALVTTNNIVSAFSLSNSLNDINTTNANNLTAQASATTTNPDGPFGYQGGGTISTTLEYAIVQKVTYSTDTTVTVQVAEGNAIPTSGGITTSAYSVMRTPYGFPANKSRWQIISMQQIDDTLAIGSLNTFYPSNLRLTTPIGEWSMSVRAGVVQVSTVSGTRTQFWALAATAPANLSSGAFPRGTLVVGRAVTYSQQTGFTDLNGTFQVSVPTQAAYSLYGAIDAATGSETFIMGVNSALSTITADNNYL